MAEQKSKNQLKIGMILSYINIGIGNLIPFFYTPLMLDMLGKNEYGLYKIASNTTSYLTLMAFGLGGAVSRYLIKARTEKGKEEEENTFGLFYLFFQIIALLTLIVGLIITFNLDLIYAKSLSPEELYRMRFIVAIMTLNTAVGFSATSYNSVVSTHERFLFIQVINIFSTVLGPVLNLIILFFGAKSIGMALSSLGVNIAIRVAYIIYVRKVLDIKPRFKKMDSALIKEILRFSFWMFVSNIVGQLYNSTDVVIIGAIPALATTGAAVYSIGYTFPNIMFSVAQVTPTLFSPKTNKMVFAGATDEQLTDFLIKAGRIQAYVVTLICSGFLVFGQRFIYYYAGEGYEEAYWVAMIIMLPNCIPLVQSVAHSIIQAKNMHRFRSIMYTFIAVLNVIGTLLLVKRYGIIGAAIPTGGALILGQGITMNWYYWKKVKLDIPRFWKNILPIFSIGLIMGVSSYYIYNKLFSDSIIILLCGIVLYTAVYGVINWFFIMKEDEKQMVLEPLKKVFDKLHIKTA